MNWKDCAEGYRDFFREQAKTMREKYADHENRDDKRMAFFYDGMASMADIAAKQFDFLIELHKNHNYVPEATD